MRFFVVNRHNGKRYPAEGRHWPEHGWSAKIFDFAPDTWGRSTTGVGSGPVIDQGFQKELEQRGWQFPALTAPADMRGQEMTRLAKSLAPKPTAESVVEKLLEHCGHCGTPTRVTLKAQPDVDLDKISGEEKKMAVKVEKEHVKSAKDAIGVAAGHWAEDPKYYAHGKKKGCFPELGKAKAWFAGLAAGGDQATAKSGAKAYMMGDSTGLVGGGV